MPQIYWPETTSTFFFYVTILLSQKSGRNLVQFSIQGLDQAAIKILAKHYFPLEAHIGMDRLPNSFRLLAEFIFLIFKCQSWIFTWVFSWRMPIVAWHMMTVKFIELVRSLSSMWLRPSYITNYWWLSHHWCHIL